MTTPRPTRPSVIIAYVASGTAFVMLVWEALIGQTILANVVLVFTAAVAIVVGLVAAGVATIRKPTTGAVVAIALCSLLAAYAGWVCLARGVTAGYGP